MVTDWIPLHIHNPHGYHSIESGDFKYVRNTERKVGRDIKIYERRI